MGGVGQVSMRVCRQGGRQLWRACKGAVHLTHSPTVPSTGKNLNDKVRCVKVVKL